MPHRLLQQLPLGHCLQPVGLYLVLEALLEVLPVLPLQKFETALQFGDPGGEVLALGTGGVAAGRPSQEGEGALVGLAAHDFQVPAHVNKITPVVGGPPDPGT